MTDILTSIVTHSHSSAPCTKCHLPPCEDSALVEIIPLCVDGGDWVRSSDLYALAESRSGPARRACGDSGS